MSNMPDRATFESAYAGSAPWEKGRPSSDPLVAVADRVVGPVLDAGCGTGENALFFAARGLRVTGIDFVEEAIRRARGKATERGLTAEFLVKDALTLGDWGERFASVIDSGLFHVFTDEQRARYVAGLAHVTEPRGGAVPPLLERRGAVDGGTSAGVAARTRRRLRRWLEDRIRRPHQVRCEP
jgi:SAM-dependent methyltransferase